MMKKNFFIFIALILFLNWNCSKSPTDRFANFYDPNYLNGTASLPVNLRPYLEGVLASPSTSFSIGKKFVLKWNQEKLSLFSDLDGIYAILDVGVNYADSSIKFAGYWRSSLVEEKGNLYFKIPKEKGGREILSKRYSNFEMLSENQNLGKKGQDVLINYVRQFSSKVKSNPFFSIIAHRCGGRNSDNIPYAENSLELVKHAAEMGATGIETDVKLTKDNIPIIYHDDDINIRLTQKGPVVGNVEDFNYNFLNQFVRLVDGQKIPTLEEMLNTIIDSTSIRFVWLDNKGGDERFFSYTIPVMYKAILKAKSQGRTILIINGIPTEEIAAEYIKSPNYKERPSLCEISLARTKELSSTVYAPRWTLGTLDDEVADAHANNIKVVTWTVDLATVMKKYLNLGDFDGILTNFPSILAYEFYIQE